MDSWKDWVGWDIVFLLDFWWLLKPLSCNKFLLVVCVMIFKIKVNLICFTCKRFSKFSQFLQSHHWTNFGINVSSKSTYSSKPTTLSSIYELFHPSIHPAPPGVGAAAQQWHRRAPSPPHEESERGSHSTRSRADHNAVKKNYVFLFSS